MRVLKALVILTIIPVVALAIAVPLSAPRTHEQY